MVRIGKLYRVCSVLLILYLTIMPPLAYADKGSVNSIEQVDSYVPYVTIRGDPLTIHVAHDSSIQVFYDRQFLGQVYEPHFNLADSGAFVWLNGRVYSPDFYRHQRTATQPTMRGLVPWVTISASEVDGDGSSTSPWTMVVTMTASATGLQLIEHVRYVNDNDYFLIDWQLVNTSTAPLQFTFFHALDLYLYGSDFGYGFYDRATGTVGGYNWDRNWYETITPLTPADNYQEALYADIWDAITRDGLPGSGFNGTILPYPDFHDDGCGLQWNVPRLDSGDSIIIRERWSFGYEQVPGAGTPTPPPATATIPMSPTPVPATPTPEPREVPEPMTLILFGGGLAMLIARLCKHKA